MGNDGGALTNKRGTLNAVLKQTQHGNDDGGRASFSEQDRVAREAKCQTCCLSRKPLWPIVRGDRFGNLYRHDDLVAYLLARKTDSASPLVEAGARTPAAQLRKLKDTVELLHASPGSVAQKIANSEQGSMSDATLLLQCSESGLCLSTGAVPFGFWFECGHVMFKGVAAESLACHCNVGKQWVPVIDFDSSDAVLQSAKKYRSEGTPA